MILAVLAAVSFSCTPAPSESQAVPGNWVWIEAESTTTTNFPPADRNPFAPADARQAEQLSGGKWIGVDSKRTEAVFAEYPVAVPSDGTYQLYARKFWKHGPYRWRIDQGAWQNVGNEVALMDEAPLRQFLGANWTHAGEVSLKKGAHTLRIELTSNEGAAAFDAFVLTMDPFIARGKLKPGQKYGRSDAGFFPFEPDPDPFKPSAIDLRFLNEKVAGEGGFIGVKGEEFVHKNTGKSELFWAINTGTDTLKLDHASIRNMARMWAKSGVNLVRVHGAAWGRDFRKADPEHIQRLLFFVDALKKEGIYTCISIYFPLWLTLDDTSGFKGYKPGQHPFAILFFNKEFQDIYRGWWRDLLTAKSPTTGKTLVQEPAVAMLEMVNEDSNLFWTFTPYENIPASQMEILEKQFGVWLTSKYGSLDKALQTWGGAPVRGDDRASGRAGFIPLWQIFSSKDQRSQDTAEFLTRVQRGFFQDTLKLLKQDLAFQGSIYGSNWITADARILGPLDKWSNAGADFMDRHGYFDFGHTGPRASYSISAGDKYEDRSALQFLPGKPGEAPNFSLPIFDVRYNGMPSTVSEINWTPPNALRADFPMVAAAYGALQRTDSIMFFATGAPWWEEMLGKFGIHTPVTFGQFPATAYMYRKGLIKAAPKVVEANMPLSDLLALKGAPVSTPASLDQLRQQDIPAGKAVEVSKVDAIDPLAFLVGKVDFNITDKPAPSKVMDLSKYIDHQKKTVRSATGELLWDYGQGLVTVNAPMAQGVTGYLSKAGTIELAAMRVSSGLEYGSVMAVALDGKPLSSSSKILLQVMSREQNYGWKTSGSGQKTIESVGAAPMTIQHLSGSVSIKRADAGSLKVTALNFNGYPTQKLGSAKAMQLRPDVLYYLIEK
ncbi:MAG: hypothetical protein ACAH95_00510 [Fimbriimonas sp.]